ncbi:hypothetical protein ACWDRX_38990, partial [Streptomyces nigra]
MTPKLKPSSTRAPPSQYQRARRSAAPANFVVHEPELTLILPTDAPAGMCGIDWDAILDQYRPLVERVA